MHLSLLSDATISDLIRDSGRRKPTSHRDIGRQQLDGLLRGLVFAAALLVPLALTFVPPAFGHPHPFGGFEVRP